MFHVRIAEPQQVSVGRVSALDDAEGGQEGEAGEENDIVSFTIGRTNYDVLSGKLCIFRQHGVEPWECLGKSRTLLIVAVPAFMSPSDFCTWLGTYVASVEHMRFIREVKHAEHRYAVLLRFSSVAESDRFFKAFQAKRFSSLSAEIARILCVSHVELADTQNTSSSSSSNNAAVSSGSNAASTGSSTQLASRLSLLLATDPLVAEPDALAAAVSSRDAHTGGGGAGDAAWAQRGAAGGATVLTELPTCPVCLERLDSSVSGVLTTLCDHSFHCACLTSWRDETCPVCRCAMAAGEEEEDEEDGEIDNSSGQAAGAGGAGGVQGRRVGRAHGTSCESCGVRGNLWMCLLCGHVGCGRYSSEHAMAHYRASGHTYAVEVGVGRVWDYAGDGYVHRLIQNKADGKLVELPDPRAFHSPTHAEGMGRSGAGGAGGGLSSRNSSGKGGGGKGGKGDKGDDEEDAATLAFEYTLLLTSQLESQRTYFEGLLSSILGLMPADGSMRREADALLYAQGHGSRLTGPGGGGGGAGQGSMESAGDGSSSSATVESMPTAAGVTRRARTLSLHVPATGAPPPSHGRVTGPAEQAEESGGATMPVSTSVDAAELSSLRTAQEELSARVLALQARLAEAETRLAAADRERRTAQRVAAQAKDTIETMSEELAFLRDLNDTVSGDTAGWRAKVSSLEAALAAAQAEHARLKAELEEQVRDLMFALEAGNRMEQARAADPALAAELDAGHVVFPGAPAAAHATARGGLGSGRKGAGRSKAAASAAPPAAPSAEDIAAAEAAARKLLEEEGGNEGGAGGGGGGHAAGGKAGGKKGKKS